MCEEEEEVSIEEKKIPKDEEASWASDSYYGAATLGFAPKSRPRNIKEEERINRQKAYKCSKDIK